MNNNASSCSNCPGMTTTCSSPAGIALTWFVTPLISIVSESKLIFELLIVTPTLTSTQVASAQLVQFYLRILLGTVTPLAVVGVTSVHLTVHLQDLVQS